MSAAGTLRPKMQGPALTSGRLSAWRLIRRYRIDRSDLAVAGPGLVACLIILWLLCYVVWISFIEPNGGLFDGPFTLSNYKRLFNDAVVGRAAVNTLQFSVISIIVAGAIGLPLAWLVERTDLPAKSSVWTLAIIGVLIPGFFTAMGWLFMLHPRIGMVNGWARALGFDPGWSIVNVTGMAFVQGLTQAPLFFLMTANSFATMDPRLEEAAYMSGASIWSVLRRIVIPLITPGVLAASIYSLALAAGAFDVPGTIGLSNRILTFTTLLYFKLYPPFGTPDYGVPAAFGSIMLIVALGLSTIYLRVLRLGRRFETISGKGYNPRKIKLGRWKIAAWAFIGVYVLFSLVGPLLLLAWAAFLPYFVPPSAAAFKLLTVQNFYIVPWDQVLRGLANTAILVLAVPNAVVICSLSTSWIVMRSKVPGRFILDAIAFLPHALPSIVFSLSAALIALFVLGRAIPLYGSLMLVGIVYTVWWVSFGTRVVNSALVHIHPELEEAASSAGASRLSILRRVLLPLLKPALTGAWLWVALLCFRELSMAVLLFSPRNVTLPVVSWSLWLGGYFNQAAVVTLVITLLCAPLIFLYFHISRRVGASVGLRPS